GHRQRAAVNSGNFFSDADGVLADRQRLRPAPWHRSGELRLARHQRPESGERIARHGVPLIGSTTTAVPYASTSVTPAATSFASYRTATSAFAPNSAACSSIS